MLETFRDDLIKLTQALEQTSNKLDKFVSKSKLLKTEKYREFADTFNLINLRLQEVVQSFNALSASPLGKKQFSQIASEVSRATSELKNLENEYRRLTERSRSLSKERFTSELGTAFPLVQSVSSRLVKLSGKSLESVREEFGENFYEILKQDVASLAQDLDTLALKLSRRKLSQTSERRLAKLGQTVSEAAQEIIVNVSSLIDENLKTSFKYIFDPQTKETRGFPNLVKKAVSPILEIPQTLDIEEIAPVDVSIHKATIVEDIRENRKYLKRVFGEKIAAQIEKDIEETFREVSQQIEQVINAPAPEPEIGKISFIEKEGIGKVASFKASLGDISEQFRYRLLPEGGAERFTGKITPTDILKSSFKELPGLFELVTQKAKSLNIALEDISPVYSIKELEDGLLKIDVLLSKTGKNLEIFARKTREGFLKEDIGKAIESYLLQTNIAKTQETAAAQMQKVMAMFEKYGFEDISRIKIRTQQPSGITFFTGEQKFPEGIKTMTVALNKYNDVITYSNRRTMEFLDAIRSYTGDVFRWSIGATLVYGSYRKISEAIDIAIKNEAALIQIGVVLGRSQENLNNIFRSAYQIAKETGEAITGVLDAYTLAYRAVGSIIDPAEKAASASELLKNALILSKLSALSAAESIDILSGALRQMQKPGEAVSDAFKRGRDLLDSWVKVSRNANVDLATLATAFSIVEENASNVGLSLEEINAVIASLAEKAGGYGGRETGNAIRMILGGLYTNQAETALARFGIATKNVNGELRNFLDISKDIYRLYEAGIIAPDQLSKLAYAIGGGVRNQQRVQWFLSDLPRIAEIVAIQNEKTGSSEQALSQITETLSTKIELLNNSFQNFAQTLGTRGGVLEQVKGLVSLFTFLVDGATKLVDVLGAFTLPASLLAIITLLTRTEGGKRRWESLTEGIDTWLLGTRFGKKIPLGREEEFFAISKFTGRVGVGAAFGALTALSDIDKAIKGDKQSWYVVGGTIAGGILGALTGNPALAYLGATIGKEFVSTVVQSSKDVGVAILPTIFAKEAQTPTGLPTLTDKETLKRNLFKRYEELLYPGLSKFFAPALIPEEFEFRGGVVSLPEKELRSAETLSAFRAMQIIQMYEEQTKRFRTRGAFGQGASFLPTEEEYQAAKRFLAELEEIEKRRLQPVPTLENTFISRFTKQYAEINKTFLNSLIKAQEEGMRTDFFRGIYTLADYGRIKQNIEAFSGFAAQIEAIRALGSQKELFTGLNEEILKTIPSAEKLIETLVFAPSEASTQINELISSITDLANQIEQAKGGAVRFGSETLSSAEAVDRLNLYLGMLNSSLEQTEQMTNRIKFDKIKGLIPQSVDFRQIENEADFQKLVSKVRELQDIKFRALIQAGVLTEDEVAFMLKNAPRIMVELGRKLGVKLVEGIVDVSLFQDAFKELLQTGEIKIGLDYQFLDVTHAQFKAIMAQYQAIRQAILQAGGQSEETPLLTFFKDSNNPFNYKMDWKIVQHLLSQILDTEKKQLDGIYNLPSEATAWVPFQSLQYAYQKGLNEAKPDTSFVPPDFTPVTDASQLTGNKLIELGNAAEMAEKQLRYLAGRGERESDMPSETPITPPSSTMLPDTWLQMLERTLLPRLPSTQGTTLPDTLEGMFNRTIESLQSFVNKVNALQINPTNPSTYYKSKDADMILTPQEMKIPQVSTNLKLDFKSSIQLVVDGRTLAAVVKNYIWEDLIKYVNSSTAATQSYTII